MGDHRLSVILADRLLSLQAFQVTARRKTKKTLTYTVLFPVKTIAIHKSQLSFNAPGSVPCKLHR